jgi:hypothetical protein
MVYNHLHCLHPVACCYIVLLDNRQHQRFVKKIQYCCINIRLLCIFATCFDPAGSSSGNFHEMYYLHWIVFLMWIHVSGHKCKFHYDSCVSLYLNFKYKTLWLKSYNLKLKKNVFSMMFYRRVEGVSESMLCFLNNMCIYYVAVFRM